MGFFGNIFNKTQTVQLTDPSTWELFGGLGGKNTWRSEQEKLTAVLTNPAVAKVFYFIAENYASVKFYELNSQGKKELAFTDRPNPSESWYQFNFNYRFWSMFGKVYVLHTLGVWHILNPLRCQFTKEQSRYFKKILFSENTQPKGKFKYINGNGKDEYFNFKDLHIINDISGGINSDFLNSPSRLDALYQVITNAEDVQRSKGVNIDFSSKFVASGKVNVDNLTMPMPDEREAQALNKNITQKGKILYSSSAHFTLDRFVKNIAQLKLDESYIADLLLIGSMYGIPKDILNILATSGAKYENMEKALGSFTDYTQMPKVQEQGELFSNILDKNIQGDFKHLPFNAIFEREKEKSIETQLANLQKAKELGLDEKIIKAKIKSIYEN